MRSYPSSITGLDHPAKDGSDRAAYCATLHEGDALRLKREPENPFDEHAVALWRGTYHVGYLPRKHAWVFRALTEGDKLKCVVDLIECDESGKRAVYVGLKISVVSRPEEADHDEEVDEMVSVTIQAAERIKSERRLPFKKKLFFWGIVAIAIIAILQIVSGNGEAQRRAYIESVRISFAAARPDIVVSGAGPSFAELIFTSPRMTKKGAENILSTMPETPAKLGFQTIEFADGRMQWRFDPLTKAPK